MTLLKATLTTGALVAGSAFLVAFAGSPAEYHAKVDANADGVVTKAEYVAQKTADGKYTEAQASEKFVKLAGSDGELSVADIEAAMSAHKDKARCSES